jgi:uncharacterized heparinase superfamily protein
MTQWARYFETVRHLRLTQIAHRIARRLPRQKPALPQVTVRAPLHAPRPFVLHADSWVADETLCFLGEGRRVDARAVWTEQGASRLWRYHLHYFDDLNGVTAWARRAWHRALIKRWIEENPLGSGDGWDPYPTSVRIVNWIKWALGGNELPPAAAQSLALQAEWLSRNLEFHLLGNHLLENAKALTCAGHFFRGSAADRWREKGLALLEREAGEQVLADGGHYERSPMYHAIVLEGLLDTVNICRTFDTSPRTRFADACGGMVAWLRAMTHPDGEIALFNDAAHGEAPSYTALADYARSLGIPADEAPGSVSWLESSGYVRAQRGRATLIMDVGAVGPDYLPAHAHADTLSFELSLDSRRVFVDMGTSTYAPGSRRAVERSTAAHNTVSIENTNSSDVWSVFRVGRRARVLDASVTADGELVTVTASHDGYGHLRCRAVHRRTAELVPGGLEIRDRIDGRGQASVETRFNLHPALRALPSGASVEIIDEDRTVVATMVPDAAAAVELGDYRYAPAFGRLVDAQCVVLRRIAALPLENSTAISWPARGAQPLLTR